MEIIDMSINHWYRCAGLNECLTKHDLGAFRREAKNYRTTPNSQKTIGEKWEYQNKNTERHSFCIINSREVLYSIVRLKTPRTRLPGPVNLQLSLAGQDLKLMDKILNVIEHTTAVTEGTRKRNGNNVWRHKNNLSESFRTAKTIVKRNRLANQLLQLLLRQHNTSPSVL
jgi:hypothetical protein